MHRSRASAVVWVSLPTSLSCIVNISFKCFLLAAKGFVIFCSTRFTHVRLGCCVRDMRELKLTEERIFFSVPVQEQDRPEVEQGCITHYTIQCYGLDRK